MTITTVVPGTLYVYCPDEASNAVRPQLDALYPGACHTEFSSDRQTIFGVADVPYPVEQARYALSALHHAFWSQGQVVSWSWTPPAGAVLVPGGTVCVRCEADESGQVLQAVRCLFPDAFVYIYHTRDQWVNYDVDIPHPDQVLQAYLYGLSSYADRCVYWTWRPWSYGDGI